MSKQLCACKCGKPARPGKKFAKYHRVLSNGRAVVWNGKKYIYRYRLIMAIALGRPLTNIEVVHHKDNNPLNDDISNLVLCASNAEHQRLFHSSSYGTFSCGICGKSHRGENRRQYHFCSRECWRKWKSPGRPRTSGVGARITFPCEYCGKVVTRKGAHGRRLFCCKECYWSDMRGQTGQVKSNSRLIEYRGMSLPLAEWARRLGLPFKTLHSRVVQYNWETERAFNMPVRARGR